MMGYFGKLLRIGPGRKTFTGEDIPGDVLECCLGGKCLGTHLLPNENPRDLLMRPAAGGRADI